MFDFPPLSATLPETMTGMPSRTGVGPKLPGVPPSDMPGKPSRFFFWIPQGLSSYRSTPVLSSYGRVREYPVYTTGS